MARIYLIFVLAFCLISPLAAQKKMSWKKQAKAAEKFFDKGNYAKAGEYFEEAWQKKQKKKELIFKAGESYYTIKDYRKAAEAYQHVREENDEFPLVGLKYARSLKQDAQYDKAKVAFKDFLEAYSGQGKAILEDIIRKEILGCELAPKLPLTANRDMDLVFPGNNINTENDEFSPFPVGDLLYFSSNLGGKARLYSSNFANGNWSKATAPANFPLINKEHYGHGALSPDGKNLFFTICSSDKVWDDLKARCELFVTSKEGDKWSKPARLPDYINLNGATATHPYVVHRGGKEYLYFVSNREGGRGGLDIWYTSRELPSSSMDFTFPVNLGPTINTIGDEITPYYDNEEGGLYFSSNGHITIGGFDVFKSLGDKDSWTDPKNVGLPVNSSADDYGYIEDITKTMGFLVSNRVFGGDKASTTHSDIFQFALSGGSSLVLSGNVYDQDSGDRVPFFKVALSQVFEGGVENLISTKEFSDGTYSMRVLPNRDFKVTIASEGYQESAFEFSTVDPGKTAYGQPTFLEKIAGGVDGQNTFGEPSVSTVSASGETYTSRGRSPNDNFEYVSSAPRYQGVYYKIQIAALMKYNPKKDLYQKVADIGRLDTEKLVNRDLTRILVADFFSDEEAFSVLDLVRNLGFDNAFVVKYENGERFGRVNNE